MAAPTSSGGALGAAPSPRATALRLLRSYLAPRWKALAGALLLAVLAGALTSALIWLLNPTIKRIFEQRRTDSLLVIPIVIVALGLLRAACQVGQAYLTNAVGHRMVGEMQVRLFGGLVRADLARLRSEHSGAYLSSVLYEAGLIREGATTGVVNYVQAAVTVAGALVVMFTQDWILSLVVLASAPVASALMRRFGRRTRKAARGAMDETSALSTAVMESLDGVRLVKIENREAFEEARVSAVVARRQRHIIKGANARAAAAPATEALMTTVLAAVFAYGGWRAVHHQIGLNQLITFFAAMLTLSQNLRQVANLQATISEGLAAAGRLFVALDVPAEVREAPGAPPLRLERAHLRLEAVDFAYGAGAPALSGVTLEARMGETVALVGPSGAGKSTVLSLIPRFYDVTGGAVTLDGQDVRAVATASLRDALALVTQEPFLFDDTIRANIAYSRPGASDAEVEAAARAAAAHGFIAELPQGYLTPVGEAGTRLSGGQRQRIAIARAFLKDAPILLLDEATSALDTESEAQVQAALDRLMVGRTVVMIAHRLSTVRNADRIYVIDAGRVVESGAHAELVARGGLYSRLARAQNLDVLGVAAPEPASAA
ncbi:MAG: ABC transporter ATP-binding protein [Caulobacteraceae bacterium]|nr:ABC transporter ATP-binding protein [Caulobacter sp.]